MELEVRTELWKFILIQICDRHGKRINKLCVWHQIRPRVPDKIRCIFWDLNYIYFEEMLFIIDFFYVECNLISMLKGPRDSKV